MKITGLSDEYGDRLFENVPMEDPRDSEHVLVSTPGRFLQNLSSLDGPDLWVGYRWRTLWFHGKDVGINEESVPLLATVSITGACYTVEFPTPVEFNMPEYSQVGLTTELVDRATEFLLKAIELSDANPNRVSASWCWYVCPKCTYYHPQYTSECIRCVYRFPSEIKCQAVGIYRRPTLPKGAAAPTKDGRVWKLSQSSKVRDDCNSD